MMIIPRDKEIYAFEVDDVLFPKRDYLLQVYYLFANFTEYTEGKSLSKSMVDFMKQTYEREGETVVLDETINHFQLPESYRENFERLKANAHLPLKLILKDDFEALAKELMDSGKRIVLLTDGNPIEQLNKLKHIEWGELDELKKQLRVYFVQELLFRNIKPNAYIAEEFGIGTDEVYPVNHL